MKLVVLDGHTLNPGDLSWDSLHAVGDCQIYDRTSKEELLTRAQDAAVLLTNKTPLRRDTLISLPLLKYIGVLATGYDVVDVEQARRQNILVTNVPAYGTNSVAQMVFALILELCNRAGQHSHAVRKGAWTHNPDWSFWQTPLVEIHGKTLGIVGYGRIGQKVAHIAHAFGMKVIATSNRRPANLTPGVQWGTLDEVFTASDFVSLHCPLQASNRSMINSTRISQMKDGAFLINTSRGGLIHEDDLAIALNSEKLAGAALDVLSTEPPLAANPLLQAKNCIITPHIAWATHEARARLMDIAIANLKAWLDGHSQNVVS